MLGPWQARSELRQPTKTKQQAKKPPPTFFQSLSFLSRIIQLASPVVQTVWHREQCPDCAAGVNRVQPRLDPPGSASPAAVSKVTKSSLSSEYATGTLSSSRRVCVVGYEGRSSGPPAEQHGHVGRISSSNVDMPMGASALRVSNTSYTVTRIIESVGAPASLQPTALDRGICATAAGFSRADKSPGSWPKWTARSTRRMILALRVRGKSGTK